MDGGFECDLLDGGPGADSMDGGTGVSCDAATYASRTNNVFVSLDSVANDGEDFNSDGVPDEGDDILRMQRVLGRSGNDSFTGDGFFNAFCGMGGTDTLNGAGGDDALNGGPGIDMLLGGAGNDELGTVPSAIVTGTDCPASDVGQDTMNGQTGNDDFQAVDGEIDQLFGGAGTDTATADPFDVQNSIP